MKIYVATSWRNKHTDEVLKALRDAGHVAYDFRADGFSWRDAGIAGDRPLTAEAMRALYEVPLVKEGFDRDMAALEEAEAVVLVLPCGRSAHLEAGHAAGAGKVLVVYQPEAECPELMHGMAYAVCGTLPEVVKKLWETIPA